VENRYGARVCPRLELEWGGLLFYRCAVGPIACPRAPPISVLISRKTQRLYVRKAFEPLESPVTIQDADRPIGTHVCTAMERTSGDTKIRWSVVLLRGGTL
jgi:hypothetical protein